MRKMVDLSSTTTNRENTRASTTINTLTSTADSFGVRGAANNRASNVSAVSQPTHVQATANSGRATENFGSILPATSSTFISNNFSVRGAANNRASGLSAVSQSTHAQAAADLERAIGRSRSILSATSSSSSSTSNNFSVRGAASNGASGSSSLSQSIHSQAGSGSGRATGNSTSIFSGYGHYSAGGVPAYPGVLGGLPGIDLCALGTQTRTPGSWTWTAGCM
jgi:hypothetical protein